MNDSLIIDNLLKQDEGIGLEFTASTEYEVIGKTITAMLNTGGGSILIGIDQNKNVIGVQNTNTLVHDLPIYLNNNVRPTAPYSIIQFTYGDRQVILISIWPGANKPYSFKNKIYTRVGEKSLLANNNVLTNLINNRKEAFFHWERQPVLGAEIDILDKEEIEKTISSYNKKVGKDTFNTSNIEEFLSDLGLFNNGHLTNAAILLFAKKPTRYFPQSRIRITAYVDQKNSSNYLYDHQFDGHIFQNIKAIWEFLTILFGQSSSIKGIQRDNNSNFPVLALREGLLNAIVHRDYSKVYGFLHISIYPDKFQIVNTGALPEGITVKDLKKDHHSILRNPDIANVCYIRGFIEMLGSGTLRMITDCRDNNFNDPEWQVEQNTTTLIFPGLSPILQKKIEEDEYKLEGVNENLKYDIKRLIELIQRDPGFGAKKLSEMIDKDISTTKRYLNILKEKGIVEFIGSAATGGYFLKKK